MVEEFLAYRKRAGALEFAEFISLCHVVIKSETRRLRWAQRSLSEDVCASATVCSCLPVVCLCLRMSLRECDLPALTRVLAHAIPIACELQDGDVRERGKRDANCPTHLFSVRPRRGCVAVYRARTHTHVRTHKLKLACRVRKEDARTHARSDTLACRIYKFARCNLSDLSRAKCTCAQVQTREGRASRRRAENGMWVEKLCTC